MAPCIAHVIAQWFLRAMARVLAPAAFALAVIAMPSWSAQTDISNSPITNSSSAQVKPNIMLLMDTSGSMGWGHMPDEVESVNGLKSVGYKSAQCNVLYYNPTTIYSLPKKADGTLFDQPSFTGARYDAYDSNSSVLVNLQTSFKAYDDNTVRNGTPSALGVGALSNDTPQAAYYYVYTGSETLTYSEPPCADTDSVTGYPKAATPTRAGNSGTWSRVIVSSTSGRSAVPDERQNFAIWYTYYRTRISLTKSAASLAFTPLTDSFRVGFITMNPKDTPTSAEINQSKYIQIANFDTTQRGLWFEKLFSQKPGGSSPAREGLARVGRHYAGQHDGINAGMAGDPLEYSCQQNFTIMTTDGYWNDQAETPNGGPLKIKGTDRVGQQDGTRTDSSGLSPRPIWEGFADGTEITTDNVNLFSKSFCEGAYFNQSTSRTLKSTLQITAATSQLTQSKTQQLESTRQNLATTSQILKTTVQNLQTTVQNLTSTTQNVATSTQILVSTLQTTRSTSQNLQSTVQNRASTVQNLKSTSQNVAINTQHMQTVTQVTQSTLQNLKSTNQIVQSTSQNRQSTSQVLKTTTQNLTSTVQNLQSTTQTTQSTSQPRQSTVQNRASTTQITQSTTQITQSTSQVNQSTLQLSRSTSQTTVSTLQQRQSTSQVSSCDASTERCTPAPVGSCTPGGLITCTTTTTGPTLVASCTPSGASASNSYVTTTCANTTTGPTGAASCTAVGASASNNYIATTCPPKVETGPTPVASCANAAASSSNNYVATTCTQTATGPSPVPSCSDAAATSSNSYVATTCAITKTGPSGVASCTPATASASNNWTTTTCGTNNTTNVPVATCTGSSPNSGNSYEATTCGSVVTTNVPVSSCTNSAATFGNNYVATTCSTNNTSNVPVQTCAASAASSTNNWTTTSCNPLVTSNVGVQTCTASGPTSVNNWTTTTCGSNNTSNVGVSSCTPSAASAGNNWVATTCPAPAVSNNVATQTCSASAPTAANNWVMTSCSTNNSIAQPAASCANSSATSANNWVATSCPAPVTTTNVAVQTCTVSAATLANNWVSTTCPAPATTTNVGVSSCSPSSASSSNSWVTTTCPAPIVANNVPVATCSASSANSGNNYVTTTCPTPNTTTNVKVASCTNANANSGNSYTKTTCTTTTLSGPTAVQTCTPVAASSGNNFQTTSCNDAVTTTGVLACVPTPATLANNWTATTCGTVTTTNVPVLTCTPAAPLASNQYTTTTCPTPITTNNVPVATCTVAAAAAGNNYVATSCPAPVTTNNVPVQTCTAAAASSTNSYTSTSCTNPLTGPTGVASCTAIAPTSGNNWVTTSCGSNNNSNVPAASCVVSGPTSSNQYTTTDCPAPNVVTTPVQSCSTVAAAAGNSYTRIDCSVRASGPDPAESCSVSSATSGNNWLATSCSTTGGNNAVDKPVPTCTPSPASLSNGWTTTSCSKTGGNNAADVPSPSCTVSGANSGNQYTDTACRTVVLNDVPVENPCSPATASNGNAYTTTTCPTPPKVTTNVPSKTCSAGPGAPENAWTTTTCVTNASGPTGVGSCTPIAATQANGWTTTSCNTVAVPAAGAASCTDEAASGANNWTAKTCGRVATGPTAVDPATCTGNVAAAQGNQFIATTCANESIGPTLTTTCTAAAADPSNGWQATACPRAPGEKIQYKTTTTVTSTRLSDGTPTGETPTVVVTESGVNDINGICYIPNVAPVIPNLPSTNPAKAGVDISPLPRVGPMPPADCTAGWPCTVRKANEGGSINSVADVAQYYYATDLRPDAEWPKWQSEDNVASVGSGPEDDRVKWQHMTTFSIALGVSGSLKYRPDYRSGSVTDGDFAMIRAGTKNWPVWPDPSKPTTNPSSCNSPWDVTSQTFPCKDDWNDPRSIDDFWHAAVNGRGQYFSAGNPTSVIAGLNGALAGIAATVGSGAAAAVSTQQPVTGNNTAFVASYTTSVWTGDVQAQPIDVSSGAVQPLTATNKVWDRSAQEALDLKIGQGCDSRNIYLIRAGATDNLVDFAWDTKTCDTGVVRPGSLNSAEKAVFGDLNVSLLSQYKSIGAGSAAQLTLAAGANLVNFLRGQHDFEGFTADDTTKLYRARDHVLGDIVNGGPVYVRAPTMNYLDDGYYDFKTAKAGRTPMLYVPANDGMLHAIYAGTGAGDAQGGKEAWAIIPSTVLPNLYKLADNSYKNTHQYFVDGTPTVADAHDSVANAWKTILVGGLNLGGKGYYALDITDPASPKAMWEFKSGACYDGTASTAGGDCHLGYTFGKPIVTKLADTAGTWVVMFTSGYNNVSATANPGDGEGYLYVLNAFTGQIIYKISTGVGSAGTPSGLGQINNFVDDITVSNTTLRVYGGDMLGNLWRFDVNDKIAPSGREATRVGTLMDKSNPPAPQPITIRPELVELDSKPMVLIATGRLLGASDVTDLQVQSVYGIVDDPLTAQPSDDLRSKLVPLVMTVTGGSAAGGTRTVACSASVASGLCTGTKGWVLDLHDPGERVNVPMKIARTTLAFGSNVPQNSACVSGGYSWFNQVDISNGMSIDATTTGGVTSSTSSVSTFLSSSLIVGFNILDVGGNTGVNPDQPFRYSTRQSDGSNKSGELKTKTVPPPGKRISWREITQ